ncbi:hypothetical protein THASP1DRAFT_28355 [Thamnocephalis sphaerospora]|uniref:Uncharacterized protein n=1 Tax=Thamnocephalis sphaerospora TaxID=78915 RepID=A0A4V1IX54_9FUNG|nr:hypothetical protein THASP1DRAFT_28355 [Thamnocephalis sphaerospora]|eukprot:RKP09869.1 hypothetical protein THASP1DRAFT_28355 [Thamnocephalis sphaerospora]
MLGATREEIVSWLGNEWVQNATYFGGVPLHPLGEQNFYQFVTNAKDSVEFQKSIAVVFQHLVINVAGAALFSRNLVISARLVRRRPHAIATHCCLIQSVIGLACVFFSTSASVSTGPNCRQTAWMTTTSERISDLCVATVLLQKAYLVTNRNRWLFLLIPVIAASAPIILYISWSAPTIMAIESGCIFVYPKYFPWLRFGLHAPMNIALTGIFFNAVYRQWKQFGSRAWEQLAKEGIQIGLLMLLSNFLCAFFIAFEVLGVYSIMFNLADWCICSFLLVMHVSGSKRKTRMYQKTPPPIRAEIQSY